MTHKELGRILGISGAMVRKLAKLGMPLSSPQAATTWRKQNVGPKLSEPSATFTAHRERQAALKTRGMEIDLARKEGQSWNELLAMCGPPVEEIRRRVMGLPTDLAGRFPDEITPPVRALMTAWIDSWLAALAADLEHNFTAKEH